MSEPDKKTLEDQWQHNWQPSEADKQRAAQIPIVIGDEELSDQEKRAKIYKILSPEE